MEDSRITKRISEGRLSSSINDKHEQNSAISVETDAAEYSIGCTPTDYFN